MDRSPSDTPLQRLNRRQFLATGTACTGAVTGCLGRSDDRTIEDWHDLDAVREYPDSDYVLGNNLNEQTAGYDEHVGDPEEGWKPIGNFDSEADVKFTGTFDGQDHQVIGLQIDRPDTDYVGLFGANEGTIENTTVTDADIIGKDAVGGLVGGNENGGKVSASSVCRADITGKKNVGSLVGVIAIGTVSVSFVREATVTGEDAVGGGAGDIVNGGELSMLSVCGADVTGEKSVGGLAGRARFEVELTETSVCEATITGEDAVGGLVGRVIRHSEVGESWVAGDVTGENAVGGFVGEQDGTVTAGYWNTELTGQEEGIGIGRGDVTGLTSAEMYGEAAAEHMGALDFDDTWTTQSGPDGYPVLQSLDELGKRTDAV